MAGQEKSAQLKELERRANDLIRIYNPLDERYVIKWDKRGGTKLFAVEAKSEAVVVRYIAKKFVKEMYSRILTKQATDAIREENERRISVGMALMDKTQKTGEQMQFETPHYMPNDKRSAEILSILWVGIESEFGLDTVHEGDADKNDTRTSFERTMEDIQDRRVEDRKVKPEVTTKDETPAEETPEKLQEVDMLKCNHPGCDFVAKAPIGLVSHKRTHRKDIETTKAAAVSNVSQ